MSVITLGQNIRSLKQAVNQVKEATQDRVTVISQEVKFESQDNKEFNDLLSEIKQEALRKIAQFYQLKVHEKTKVYQTELSNCDGDYTEILGQIGEQQEYIEKKIGLNVDKKQLYDRQILNMVIRAEQIRNLKRTFHALKSYRNQKQWKRKQNTQARSRYQGGLYSKVFYYWRSSCHQDGYQNMLVNQASKDIKNIQQQFLDIIKVLKTKISETDEQLQIKKNAKAEFSYSLSRNLLKTISNLSMEVMSLHQVTIKDNQINNDENTKFLKEVNQIVATKLNNVQQLREKLKTDESTSHQKKQSIQFDLQNQTRK